MLNTLLIPGKIYSFTFKLNAAIGYFIGISTRLEQYEGLFTEHQHAYAFSNIHGKLIENGKMHKNYYGQIVSSNQSIKMIINTAMGEIAYVLADKNYGVAFRNLDFCGNIQYFPAVSAISDTHILEILGADMIHLV